MKSSWFTFAYFFTIALSTTSSRGVRRVRKGPISEALSLGQTTNTSRDDCVWRVESDSCSKTSVKFILHTVGSASSEVCDELDKKGCAENTKKEPINIHSPAWLHSSGYDPAHETIVLIHGYGGFSDKLPAGVLKDAYLRNGSYNVIVVDWTELSKLPCYIAAVHNMKAVAKCVAELFTFLRNSGVDVSKTICVGHSLGAHICGITANFLNFRMHKIIGVDPAKPFVPNNAKGKLDVSDAVMVQVLHTSSNYGDSKKAGHIDIYFNGGRIQPFCSNASDQELCSHTRSVCYLAESIFSTTIRYATKCRRRNIEIENNLSRGIFNRLDNPHSVPIGQATPIGTFGTYCVSNPEPPFCSKNSSGPSHPLCCKTTNIDPPPILCCQDEDMPIS